MIRVVWSSVLDKMSCCLFFAFILAWFAVVPFICYNFMAILTSVFGLLGGVMVLLISVHLLRELNELLVLIVTRPRLFCLFLVFIFVDFAIILFVWHNFLGILAFVLGLFGGLFVLLLYVYILRESNQLRVRIVTRIVTRIRIWREKLDALRARMARRERIEWGLRQHMCELNENGSFRIFSELPGEVAHGRVVLPPGRCDYEEDCSICFERMVLNDRKQRVCVTSCGHAYHSACLREVYTRSGNSSHVRCPLCRGETFGAFELEKEVTKNRYYTCRFFSTSRVV